MPHEFGIAIARMNIRDANGAEHDPEDGRFTGEGGGGGKEGGGETNAPEGGEVSEERRKEVRGKFEKAPTLEATTDEIKALDKSEGVSKALIDWATKKGILGDHANEDTGWGEIEITRSSVRNVIGHNAGDGKLAILGVAPDLIKTGIYLETTERNEKGHVSHIFAGKVKVDGEQYAVGFAITEDVNGRRYYNHEMTEIEKALGGIWPDKASPVLTSTSANREPINNIVRKYLSVKGKSEEKRENKAWNIDPDGMLRVSAYIIKGGVFPYRADDLPEDFRQATGKRDTVREFINPASFTDEVLKTLEGKPVVAYEHEWIEAGGKARERIVGNIAGTPTRTEDGRIKADHRQGKSKWKHAFHRLELGFSLFQPVGSIKSWQVRRQVPCVFPKKTLYIPRAS